MSRPEWDKIAGMTGVEAPRAPAPRKNPRERQKAIITWHNAEVRKQFKQLALDLDKSQQELMVEALNDLFLKHRRQPIA